MVRSRRHVALLAALLVPATSLVVAAPADASLPATPSLSLDRVLRTTPFAGSGGEVDDVEGVAYVARDDALWLADDNGNAIYEVDATSGELRRTLGVAAFGAVPQLGGDVLASLPRFDDLESLAYDEVADRLYVFSGSCCTSAVLPTAYRMTRVDGRLELESYQPLAAGTEFTAAGWNPADGKLYVGSGDELRAYDYATSSSSASFAIDGVDGILGLDFTDDGRDLLVAHSSTHVSRVDWGSRSPVPGWDLDLEPFGVLDARGVEVVAEQLWVPDGYGDRPDGDERDRAVFVFDVGASGPPPPPPPPAAPTAAFDTSALAGPAPLTVSFTDTSTGGPTSWTWDFGDGATATAAHPTHTYLNPGTFTARLTVANAGGSSSTTRSIVVAASVVTPPPSSGGGEPPPPPSSRAVELVGNPGFESGLDGWRSGRPGARLTRVRGGHSGTWAARVASRGERRTIELDDAPGWAPTTRAGTYTAAVWVRTKDAGAKLVLRLDERRSGDRVGTARTVRRLPQGWTEVRVAYVPRVPGASRLDLSIVLHGQRSTTWFKADDVRLSVT